MHAEVRDALARVKDDASVRVMLLTGAGRGFCAGQDLSRPRRRARRSAGRSRRVDRAQLQAPRARRCARCRCRSVCAVNGVAAGAGANLALACDLVIAAKSASVHPGVLQRSASFPTPAARTSCRASSAARARWGSRFSATSSPRSRRRQWGSSGSASTTRELPAVVDKLLEQLAQAPTRGLAAIKQALHAAGRQHARRAARSRARPAARTLGTSDDYREGVAAFTGKRPPHFTGR